MSPIKSTRSPLLRSAHVDPSIGVNPDKLRRVYALPTSCVGSDIRDEVYQETALYVLELRASGKTTISPVFAAMNAYQRVRASRGANQVGCSKQGKLRQQEVTDGVERDLPSPQNPAADLERSDAIHEAFRLLLKRLGARNPDARALIELALETGDVHIVSHSPSNEFKLTTAWIYENARRDSYLRKAVQEALYG